MPGNGSTPYYASRPTILVDGEIRAVLGDALLQSLLIEESTLGLFRCEARFINWGPREDGEFLLLFDQDWFDFGKPFAVQLGPPGSEKRLFNGRITAIEAQYPQRRPPEVTVLAEDRFQDLRMERRTRFFEDVSDSDVVNQIAAQHGLTAQVDAEGPTYRMLAQLNQSDLAFLRERAAAIDAELWMDDRTLHCQTRSQRDAGTVTLEYGRSLLEFSVLADLSHQRSSVRVSGWDVGSKEAIDVAAGAGTISGELNGHRGGSTILAQALAERNERIVCAVPLSTAEAQAMADARYRARARRFLCGTGLTDGKPDIRVGTTVDLQGLGERFNGRYYVTLARHTFDLINAYRTTFEVERPGIGG